jgi:recombinational DNA repair protein (RecF pathway)
MTTALATATAPALTALDRCDRCGAQAQVRAVLPTGELLFCGHHARQYADALERAAAHVVPGAQAA